ncbi:MAG: RluA family pseudouridine synthase [Clostridia bacterium]|nr:RluA family pseudouridine synthase [Clostridia bacterium]
MKTYVCNSTTDLKKFTDAAYPQGSFVFQRLLQRSDIKVNGKRVKRSVALLPGDEIVYYTNASEEAVPSHICVYSDDNIYIADKFQGVSSEALETELKEKGDYRLVHRIDRNTAGLLLFALGDEAEEILVDAFRARAVEKKYLCLCKNNFTSGADMLRAYLIKDSLYSKARVTDSFLKGSKEIVTEYSVLEKRGDVALVSVTLHTGRTHQIRAHMAHIGCPVLGDEKYGDEKLNAKYNARRQRLVAKEMTFKKMKGKLSYLSGSTYVSSQNVDELG